MSSENIVEAWRESAQYWAKHSDLIRMMFMPLTRALIEHAGIHEGQSVLDVAGGSGEPSLTIAEVVGPAGSVTCTDAVQEMVETARRDAQRRGVTNVQFRQCMADALPFPSDSFDVTVCRLGAMFFPDPVAGIREMLRVTKPSGSLALAVWHKSELNPFCHLITSVIDRHINPGAPNAFRFAEPGKLAGVMTEAGASDVKEHVVKFNLEAPLSPHEFWAMRSQLSDTLREKLAKVSAEEQAQITGEVEQAVQEFFPANQMRFPTQMIIVTGKKPGIQNFSLSS
jgi:ubiquinone/menaquinone biosynthesis C-methylase UbiE